MRLWERYAFPFRKDSPPGDCSQLKATNKAHPAICFGFPLEDLDSAQKPSSPAHLLCVVPRSALMPVRGRPVRVAEISLVEFEVFSIPARRDAQHSRLRVCPAVPLYETLGFSSVHNGAYAQKQRRRLSAVARCTARACPHYLEAGSSTAATPDAPLALGTPDLRSALASCAPL